MGGAKPIPPDPVDGHRYSGVSNNTGYPPVLEYDADVGAFRPVVATDVFVSGTVTVPHLNKIEDSVTAFLSGTVSTSEEEQDAFGRLRVSNPVILFDSVLQYDLDPLAWDTLLNVSGTATHIPNESSAELRVDTSVDSAVIRQTKAYHRYYPAHSQKIDMTFVFGSAVENVSKLVGYGDEQNGIFLTQSGLGVVSAVRRTFVSGVAVDEAVAQSAWNRDRLDGSGPSGLTIDWTKVQILQIDLQWLGAGRVRLGLSLGGRLIPFHEFTNANVLANVYMTSANLPIRYEITSDGAAAAPATLKQICCSVVAEGVPPIEKGRAFSADNGVTARTFATSLVPVLAVRPAATFNGLINHGQMLLESIGLLPASGAAAFKFVVLYNPTLTGGSWAAVNGSSIAEFNVGVTGSVGGIPIYSGHVWAAAATRIPQVFSPEVTRLPWVVDASGLQIPIAIACIDSAGTSTVLASMSWRELR